MPLSCFCDCSFLQEHDLTVSELKLCAVIHIRTRSSAVVAEETSLKIGESELWQAVSGWKMYIPKTESQMKL